MNNILSIHKLASQWLNLACTGSLFYIIDVKYNYVKYHGSMTQMPHKRVSECDVPFMPDIICSVLNSVYVDAVIAYRWHTLFIIKLYSALVYKLTFCFFKNC